MRTYKEFCELLLRIGQPRPTRVGPAHSWFGMHFACGVPVANTFPILTSRRVPFMPIAGELAAFLTGKTDLQTFKDFGCNYWDKNAEAWGLPGMVGKIYGYQWRNFNGVDQLKYLIDGIRDDPYGRRHLISAWNPADLDDMCLPPCHVMAQFYVRDTGLVQWLDCHVTMRSVDVALGLPADMVLYGLMLSLVAETTGYSPGFLSFSFGDAHIYDTHRATLKEQLRNFEVSALSPRIVLKRGTNIFNFTPGCVTLEHYTPAAKEYKYELLV